MGEQQAKDVRAGYRTVAVLLVLGLTSIGFTRFEDRAIIGAPGSPANAMAAIAAPASSDSGETYSDAPDNSVSLSDATRLPANRMRRILRDRDVANAAARQILAPSITDSTGTASAIDLVTPPPSNIAFAPVDSPPPSFGTLGPALLAQGAPLFAASLPNNDGGVGGGAGGGGGGVPAGGDTGVPSLLPTPPDTPTPDVVTPEPTPVATPTPDPVTPVPEPGAWLMLIMGLFAVGGSLRYRGKQGREFAASQLG